MKDTRALCLSNLSIGSEIKTNFASMKIIRWNFSLHFPAPTAKRQAIRLFLPCQDKAISRDLPLSKRGVTLSECAQLPAQAPNEATR